MPAQAAQLPRAWAALVLGLAAGLAQVVLLRELLVLAGGREICLALGLAAWLGLAALAAWLAGRIAPRLGSHGPGRALLLGSWGGLLSLALARLAPLITGHPLGQVDGLGQLVPLTILVLAPAAVAGGAAFPLLLAGAAPQGHSPRAAAIYGLEALGAALAGALFALLLAPWLSHTQIIMAGALLPALLLAAIRRPRGGWSLAWCLLLALALVASPAMERVSMQLQWGGRSLAGLRGSPYAQLAATREVGQLSFYANGAWLFSTEDQPRRQRVALLPILAQGSPSHALFIGGAASGAAALAARRAPRLRVTALELDPWLVDLATAPDSFPPPNLALRIADGRRFLAQTQQRYDLVVVDQPPPSTVAGNRFYSLEGLGSLSRALTPQGVAVLILPGMEHLVGRLQADRLACLLAGARRVFSKVVIFSGPELMLFLGGPAAPLSPDPALWATRLADRPWSDLASLRPDTLAQGLAPLRLAFLNQALAAAGPQTLNQDLRPWALLLDPDLWGPTLSGSSSWAQALRNWNLSAILVFLLAAALLWALVQLLVFRRASHPALGLAVFTTGLSATLLSLLLLSAYSVLLGTVYTGLAWLLAGFMAGGGLAALAAASILPRLQRPHLWLALDLGLLVLACLLARHIIAAPPSHYLAATLVCLAALNGALTGAAFALALKAWPTSAAGTLYALDLAGGLAGALAPLALLPALGLPHTLLALAAANLVALAGLCARLR